MCNVYGFLLCFNYLNNSVVLLFSNVLNELNLQQVFTWNKLSGVGFKKLTIVMTPTQRLEARNR